MQNVYLRRQMLHSTMGNRFLNAQEMGTSINTTLENTKDETEGRKAVDHKSYVNYGA